MSRLTVSTLRRMKEADEKIAALTAYDASFARLLEESGVEVLLVGDSLGMVLQGRESTVPVTMEQMIYHTEVVSRGSSRALIMADMPFATYGSPDRALDNAARLMGEGGAHMVKLEVNRRMLPIVEHLATNGVPVCAHLGLLPQTVHKLGGYKVQARGEAAAEALIEDAVAMEQAGADVVLLECVTRAVARAVSENVRAPVIGIGAAPECDGQVLVLYDMLGITPGKRPKFSRDFMAGADSVEAAVRAYVAAVKDGSFPAEEHCFS